MSSSRNHTTTSFGNVLLFLDADATIGDDVNLDDIAPTLSDLLKLNQDDRELENRSLIERSSNGNTTLFTVNQGTRRMLRGEALPSRLQSLSHPDYILSAIATVFALGLFADFWTPLSTPTSIGSSSLCCLLIMGEALFRNPPVDEQ